MERYKKKILKEATISIDDLYNQFDKYDKIFRTLIFDGGKLQIVNSTRGISFEVSKKALNIEDEYGNSICHIEKNFISKIEDNIKNITIYTRIGTITLVDRIPGK